ncbi:MAG: folylpolyglutamate synthase/dihydrofolate synthase family protein [candidate division WOR-3 bacterium]
MNYQTALDFLNSLVNYEKRKRQDRRFKLNGIRRFLLLAENPQKRLKNCILIAGTKGKGSVAYMVAAGLRACGFKTGLFVSPHLISVRERIQINGEWIKRERFARLMSRFQPLVKKQRVSYFELLTAMAFDFFAREEVDFSVIEVGLGGRLDATNLCEPKIAVITRIGYDHLQVLGTTLKKIAREKAGIMRPEIPVVIGLQEPEAENELLLQATEIGAQSVLVKNRSRVWDETITPLGIAFSAFTELGAGRVELKVLGRHQIENCRTALTVLGILARQEPRIDFARAVAGIKNLVIPGRCEVVQESPLVIVDSCHNPESGQALAGVLKEYLKEKVVLIYGSLRNKLVKRTVEPIAPYVDTAVLVAPNSPRALTPRVLKGILTRLKVAAETAPDLKTALTRAQELSFGRMPIVIAGSFYLAGEALSLLKGIEPE